jgi:hypothetical protein
MNHALLVSVSVLFLKIITSAQQPAEHVQQRIRVAQRQTSP